MSTTIRSAPENARWAAANRAAAAVPATSEGPGAPVNVALLCQAAGRADLAPGLLAGRATLQQVRARLAGGMGRAPAQQPAESPLARLAREDAEAAKAGPLDHVAVYARLNAWRSGQKLEDAAEAKPAAGAGLDPVAIYARLNAVRQQHKAQVGRA